MILSKNNIIKYAIMFLIAYLIGALPVFGNITPYGMSVLGVFIAVVLGWIFIDTLPVTLCGFLMLLLFCENSITNTISTGFSNVAVINILASTIFAGLIAETYCFDYITNRLLRLPIIQKSPFYIIVCIFLLCVIGSFCGMGYAAIFLLWQMVFSITDNSKIERKSPFVTYMLSTISILVLLTGLCFPWRSQTLMYVAIYNKDVFVNITYLQHMFLMFLFVLIFISLMLLIAKLLFASDLKKISLNYSYFKKQNIDFRQKLGLISVFLFTMIMLLPSILPTTSSLSEYINKFGIVGLTFITLIVFSLVTTTNGEKMFNIETAHKMIPWEIIWMLALVLPLGNIVQSDNCGIMKTIVDYLSPIFTALSPNLFMIVAVLTMCILSQFLNNMVLATILMPIFYSVSVEIGCNSYALFICLMVALHCDASTPAGSINGVVVHGNKDINKKYAYLVGMMQALISVIICIVVLIPFASLIG